MAIAHKTLSGFNKNTSQNLQLNAGMFVKDYDPLTGTLETATILGATSGGGTFTAVPEMRAIEVDGVRGVAKGMQVLDSWEIKMTTTLKESTAENFKLALASAKVTQDETNKYEVITANNFIDDTDYIPNVCWLGTISGSDKPICIKIMNVLNTNGLNFTFEDKGEGSIALELMAHYDSENLDSPPFEIYVPTKTTTT